MVMKDISELTAGMESLLPTDPATYKGLNPYRACGCDFKKCCKKYKKGKRCGKCPKRK